MKLTSKEQAVIYNSLRTYKEKLEKLVENKPLRLDSVVASVFEDIQDQLDTIDELFESGKF